MAPEQHEYDRPGSHSDSGYEHVNYATGNHQGRSGTSADPSSALSDQHRRGSNVSSISSVSASSTIVTTHQGIDNIKRSDSKPHYPPILLRPVSLSALHQYANEVQSGGGTDGQRSLYSQCHPQQQRQQHYEEDDRLSGGDGGERRRGSRGSGLATNGGGGYYDTFADTTGPMGPPPPGQPLYLAHRAPSPSTLSSTTTAATGTAMHHQIQHQHPFTHSPPPLSATSTSSALSMQTDMTGSTSVSGGSSAACTATLSMGTGVGTGTATNGIHSLINRKRKSGEIDSASGLSRPPSSASLRGSFKVGDLSHDRHEDGREDEEEEERDAQYRLQRQYHHSTLYHYPGDKRFGPDAECGGEAGEEVTHEDRKNSRGGQNEDDDVLSETQGLSPLAAPKKKAAYHRHSLSQPISSMQTPKHGHHPQHQHHHQSTHDTPHFPYPPQQENQHQHQQEQAPSSDVASQQYSQYQRYQQPHPVHHHHHHPSLPPSQMIAAREPAYTSTMVYPPSSRPHLPPYHS
ncbi:hypothetical protein BGZ73_007585 [Actinomortierella ambigua]|nr:hypothetical protein BGZ73_007585 [Actinomortierella ambigua]